MAWQGSTRASRLPADWPARRAATAARAGGQCQHHDPDSQRCPAVGSECDHIVASDDHGESNLQWLCHEHHLAKTKAESAAARWQHRAARPRERHPGLR